MLEVMNFKFYRIAEGLKIKENLKIFPNNRELGLVWPHLIAEFTMIVDFLFEFTKWSCACIFW